MRLKVWTTRLMVKQAINYKILRSIKNENDNGNYSDT